MKAIKMMMFVAAATMLFASCNKDELDLENNQLRYDGTVYNMTTSATSDAQGTYVSYAGVCREVLWLYGIIDQCFHSKNYGGLTNEFI